MPAGPVLFRERQRFTQWWLWVTVLAGAVAAWAPLALVLLGSEDPDDGPAWVAWLLAAAVGLGLPLLFGLARLTVEVTSDQVLIRYRPFRTRIIPLTEVVSAEAVTYRPVREYGGWGIKGWSRRKVAYNVSGNRGALLTLHDGRTVLIGSRQPDALADTIRRGLPAARRTG